MLLIFGAAGGIGSGLMDAAMSSSHLELMGVTREDCDFDKPASVERFFSNTNRLGDPEKPLYCLNATGKLVNGTIANMSLADLDFMIQSNVRANFLFLQNFIRAAKTRPGSCAVLLSSVVARLGVVGAGAYGMCKAAQQGLVRTAAQEFARYRVRANCVEMGYYDTGMINQIPASHIDGIRDRIPLGRFGNCAELFDACASALLNPYMTGATLTVSGGL